MAKKKVKKTTARAGKKKPAVKVVVKNQKKSAKKAVKKPAKKKVVKSSRKVSRKPEIVAVPKSTKITFYLTFNGNCEEAFNFYKSVFGGEFTSISRFKEMPPQDGKPVSESDGEKIMHISLPVSKDAALMGSDGGDMSGIKFVAGNNFSLSIYAVNKSDADRMFNGLSAGGVITMPMNTTFWGSYFGMLTDKYGIQWMISFELGQQKQ